MALGEEIFFWAMMLVVIPIGVGYVVSDMYHMLKSDWERSKRWAAIVERKARHAANLATYQAARTSRDAAFLRHRERVEAWLEGRVDQI